MNLLHIWSRWIRILVFGVLIAIIAAQCVSPMPPLPQTPEGPFLKIGVILPTSGEMRTFGEMLLSGFEAAFDRWNEDGGVKGNYIIWQKFDSGCSEEKAEQAIEQLKAQGIQQVLGPLCSQEALPIADAADDSGILLIVPTATAPWITVGPSGKVKESVFKLTYDQEHQAKLMAQMADSDLHVMNALVIYDPLDDISKSLKETFIKNFSGQSESIELSRFTSADFQKATWQSYYITLDIEQSKQVVDKLGQDTGGVVILGTNRWDGPEFDKHPFEGAYYPAYFSMDYSEPQYQEWIHKYQSTYAVNPTEISALGYESADVLLEAFSRSNNFSISSIVKILKEDIFSGLMGILSFDEHHNACRAIPILQILNNQSKLSRIMQNCPP